MLSIVRHTLKRFSMIREGDVVIVALSGGADSTCLADVMDCLKDELQVKLAVAHFEHGIRGETALADAQFSRRFAEARSLPFFPGEGNVPELAKREGLSIEEAARRARYDFFETLPHKFPGIDLSRVKVALGHTANDQAETVLMRLLRGSGPRGLGGIPPVRGRYIRPLIETTRAAIVGYLGERGIAWREDETNISHDHLRNRVRRDIMPTLVRDFNPNLIETLSRSAESFRDAAEYLDAEAVSLFAQCKFTEDTALIPRKLLRQSHPALANALIEAAINRVAGTLWKLRSDHRHAILESSRAVGTAEITLPGGIDAEIGSDWVKIGSRKDDVDDFNISLVIPGITRIESIGVTIEASIIDMPYEIPRDADPRVAHFDIDRLTEPILARNFQPGDRIQPLGMEGAKKLQDLFVDMKVPREFRRRIPIVTAGGAIVWVAPLRMAHPFRITSGTKRLLKLVLSESPYNPIG